MTALELLDIVLAEDNRVSLPDHMPAEIFRKYRSSLLNHSVSVVQSDSVDIIERHDTPNAWDVLKAEIAAGYWVYTFSFCVYLHSFRWFKNKADAVNFYHSLDCTKDFLSHKHLIHTSKGVLMAEECSGNAESKANGQPEGE